MRFHTAPVDACCSHAGFGYFQAYIYPISLFLAYHSAGSEQRLDFFQEEGKGTTIKTENR